jgi:hypothetical protein
MSCLEEYACQYQARMCKSLGVGTLTLELTLDRVMR